MANIKDLMRPAFAQLDGGLFSVTEKWHSPNDVRENAKTSSKCKNHSVF